MELRQLEYLVTVAEEASFTRAAERLHVAQPGVSAQVRRLEAELGEALLDRSGGTVRPTDAGRAVLPHARAALAAVAAVRGTVQARTGLLAGHVAVGIVSAGTAPRLPDLLAAFRRAHPGVRVTLTEAQAEPLAAAVLSGDVDLAVLAAVEPLPPALATHRIAEEALVAAVAPGHPLARRTTITLAALAEHDLIALPPGAGLRTGLDAALARAGVRATVALEANDPPMLAELAARGLGVAVVPESITRARPETLHALALRPALKGRVELAWRAAGPWSPAARALIDDARAILPA